MLGSIVEETYIRKGMNQINASSWTPGVYFIRVSNGAQSSTQKVIKQLSVNPTFKDQMKVLELALEPSFWLNRTNEHNVY